MELRKGYIYIVEAFNFKICERKPKTKGGEENIIYKQKIWQGIVGNFIYVIDSIIGPTGQAYYKMLLPRAGYSMVPRKMVENVFVNI